MVNTGIERVNSTKTTGPGTGVEVHVVVTVMAAFVLEDFYAVIAKTVLRIFFLDFSSRSL
jgi:hypothetical protein